MSEHLERITCSPTCGFTVQSHNENELIDMTQNHLRNFHPSDKSTREDLKKKIEILK